MFGSKKRQEERAREIARNRSASETELRKRPDRVYKYLKKHMDKFVFDEFSDGFLKKTKMDIMKGVPIPLRKEDVKLFASGDNLKPNVVAENMTWVMGIDPKFEYVDKYIDYMEFAFKLKFKEAIIKEAKDEGEREELDSACIHFRAALCIDPFDLQAMYGYARACRAMYLEGGSSDYVGDLKAEALEYFELLTEIHPKFAEAHYYLGYAYLNLGLYQKANLIWQLFIKKTNNNKDRKEIEQRIKQLETPLQIEKGYNAILAFRFDEGITILEPFLKTNYKEWWPLHYYLGIGYSNTGKKKEAIQRFEKTLLLNPSHIETMDELAGIYRTAGKQDLYVKYHDKAELLKRGGHKEKDKKDLAADRAKEDVKEIRMLKKEKEKEIDTAKVRKIKRLDKKDE